MEGLTMTEHIAAAAGEVKRPDVLMTPEEIEQEFGQAPTTLLGIALPTRRQQLRDYQIADLARVLAAIEAGQRSILLVVPTGGGKTVIAAELILTYVRDGKSVLIIVHREELLGQMAGKLDALGIDYGIIKAGHPSRPEASVQIASIQTLHARAVRSSRIEMPPADLVVFDEAHHCTANTWLDVVEHYTKAGAVVFGMTATPCRGDGRGLGNVFSLLIEGPTVARLTADGWLVPATVYAPYKPDLTGVRLVAGEYNEGQLADVMNQQKLVGDVVLHYFKINTDRRPTVVFAVNVAHAASLCNAFRDSGVLAEVVTGATPLDERRTILAKLERGEIDVVVNCAVLTEGWDSPAVSCLILARPTKSLGLFRQMVGRVLRPHPGKTDALVIDHAGAVFEHGRVEDHIEWTLHKDQRARNKSQASRQPHSARELLTCPECTAIRTAGDPCPNCGWRPKPKAKEVEVIEGDLQKLERGKPQQKHEHTAAEREAWHRQLTWIGRERNYKSGWPAVQYREKFGVWPVARHVSPMMPTDEVRRWVKSRMIAYAKGMAARGAA
jgi:DNA repair protein RadD